LNLGKLGLCLALTLRKNDLNALSSRTSANGFWSGIHLSCPNPIEQLASA